MHCSIFDLETAAETHVSRKAARRLFKIGTELGADLTRLSTEEASLILLASVVTSSPKAAIAQLSTCYLLGVDVELANQPGIFSVWPDAVREHPVLSTWVENTLGAAVAGLLWAGHARAETGEPHGPEIPVWGVVEIMERDGKVVGGRIDLVWAEMRALVVYGAPPTDAPSVLTRRQVNGDAIFYVGQALCQEPKGPLEVASAADLMALLSANAALAPKAALTPKPGTLH